MGKKISFGVLCIAAVLLLNVVLVLLQGVSFRYWAKLGFPNAIKVFTYKVDEYPGHSLECIRFPDKLMQDKKDKETLEYADNGTGIDINGYHVHIGDTKEHVMEEFVDNDSESNGSEYELGCFFCDTGYFLKFDFEYDANDVLKKMKVQKNCYR